MSSLAAGRAAAASLPVDRYLELVQQEAARFAEVARALPPTVRSRSYPGYDAESLTVHVGSTLVRSTHVVRTGELLQNAARLVPPPHLAAADWVEQAAEDFVAEARRADPAREVPTFPLGEIKPLTFVYRSALTELTVHRWDLESAAESHATIAADFAVTAVDSVFEWWAPVLLADRRIGLYLGGTVVLEAADAGVRWAVSVEDGQLVGRRTDDATGADAVLRGPAELVLLAFWKRLPVDAPGLRIQGNVALVHRLVRIPYVPDPQISAAH